jgi:AcrR family transcriptional regulator
VDAGAAERARRPGRPARLDREAIVGAALSFDLDAITMHGVARRLGVSAQALYRWVSDREELLDLVSDVLVERVAVPPAPQDGDWRGWLVQLGLAIREAVRPLPGLAARQLLRYRISPPYLRLAERVVRVLVNGGLDPPRAELTYAIFGAAVFGWIAREQSVQAQVGAGRRLDREVEAALRGGPAPLPLLGGLDPGFGSAVARPPDFEEVVTAIVYGLPPPAVPSRQP